MPFIDDDILQTLKEALCVWGDERLDGPDTYEQDARAWEFLNQFEDKDKFEADDKYDPINDVLAFLHEKPKYERLYQALHDARNRNCEDCDIYEVAKVATAFIVYVVTDIGHPYEVIDECIATLMKVRNI